MREYQVFNHVTGEMSTRHVPSDARGLADSIALQLTDTHWYIDLPRVLVTITNTKTGNAVEITKASFYEI